MLRRRRRSRGRRGLGRLVRSLVEQVGEEERREVGGILLVGAAALFFYALQAGGPGALGRLMEAALRLLLGNAAFLLPLLLAVWGLALIIRWEGFSAARRAGLLLACLLAVVAYSHAPRADLALAGWRFGAGGGMLGAGLDFLLLRAVGPGGRAVVLGTLALVAAVLLTGFSVGAVLRGLGKGIAGVLAARRAGDAGDTGEVEEAPAEGSGNAEESGAATAAGGAAAPAADGADATSSAAAAGPEAGGGGMTPGAPGDAAAATVPRPGDARQGLPAPSPETTRPEAAAPAAPAKGGEERRFQQLHLKAEGIYQIPPVTLLRSRAPKAAATNGARELQAMRKALEDTLRSFGVEARVIDVQRGPAVTRFEVQPAPGVKVARIASLADDIALSMAAPGVRIVAPIPGKAAMGIEVPNREVSTVYLRDVLESPEFQNSPSRLTVALGQDIGGRPVVSSLDRMVHLLIAGATGSGKSVMVNALLASLLFKAGPADLRLLLIDPKVVELSAYNGIPHLLTPVVTDPKRAAGCLRWVIKEMESRYEAFAQSGVRDIHRFNQWALAHERRPLPYIVVVIDELADLMMVAPAEVEDAIQRLAQMARAAGIHLVVATQRPSVDVITGVIKANIPSRIAFAVASQVDSRTILDMAGAEKLLGKGDMLFHPLGAAKPVRVQGAYLPEPELEVLLDYVKGQGAPEYDAAVTAEQEPAAAEQDWGDDLFPEAVRVVLETGQASVSIVQRRLRVGYTRAGRLIDMMEERGIVGPHQGPKPREILISPADYERIFGSPWAPRG